MRKLRLIAVALISILTITCSAQYINNAYVQAYDTASGFVFFNQSPLNSTKSKILDEVFNLSGCEYKLQGAVISGEQDSHYKYNLFYYGIKVEGYEFAVHLVGDKIKGNGKLLKENLEISVDNTSVEDSTAIQTALADMNSDLYYWQDSLSEADLKEKTGKTDTSYYPSSTLSIVEGHLTKRIKVLSLKPLSEMLYFIDAQNGTIIKKQELSCGAFEGHKNKGGGKEETQGNKKDLRIMESLNYSGCSPNGCNPGNTAVIKYYGTQSIDVDRTGNTNCKNRTKDVCNPAFLYVRHPANSNPDYENSNNFWGSTNQKGTTPLWCAERVYEYFYNVHGRNSYDNNFAQVSIWTDLDNGDFSEQFTPYKIANNEIRIKGDWTDVVTTVASEKYNSDAFTIDIIAHEFSHMMVASSANIGTSGEAGAINEAICDMFAIDADFYTKSTYSTGVVADYRFADEASASAYGIRNLANPGARSHPRFLNDPYWINPSNTADNGYVHINCEVMGYWFYLLSEGTNGDSINYIGKHYCVKGIGRDKAIKIVYKALVGGYYNTSTDFTNVADQTIWAASDLYGYFSPEVAEAEAAFYAIGVKHANQNNPYPPTITMPYVLVGNKVDNTSHNYNFNNVVTHQSYTATGGGASYDVSSGTELLLSPNTHIYGTTYYGHTGTACSSVGSGARSWGNGQSSPTTETPSSDNAIISKAGTDFDFTIVPNPTSGNVNLVLNNATQYPESITILNALGNCFYKNTKPNTYELNVDISSVPTGLYIVQLNYGGKVISKRLIKN